MFRLDGSGGVLSSSTFASAETIIDGLSKNYPEKIARVKFVGSADGLKIDPVNGNVYATAPGSFVMTL